MTQTLFRDDPYLRSCEAKVMSVNERGGILLDRTVFYATAGGQPGDSGEIRLADGGVLKIATTVYDADRKSIVHVAEGAAPTLAGQTVECTIDWDRRHAIMRVHTCLHLLCALLPYPVTGGQVGAGEGRLDFDIPEAGLDKEVLTERLNELIGKNAPVRAKWISDAELEAKPEIVRTMAVKPPMGTGKVRLIEIEGIDLQPCGGTHVKTTAEIGKASVAKIEKKGAINRRVRVTLG